MLITVYEVYRFVVIVVIIVFMVMYDVFVGLVSTQKRN